MRSGKNHHVLDVASKKVAKAVAPLNFRVFLKTLCGFDLHQNIDLEAEIAALPDTGDSYGLFRHSKVTGRPGFYHPPPPSEDPSYEAYRRVGSDAEILVADAPTCKSCLRSYKP
jgi:hypothetical protein